MPTNCCTDTSKRKGAASSDTQLLRRRATGILTPYQSIVRLTLCLLRSQKTRSDNFSSPIFSEARLCIYAYFRYPALPYRKCQAQKFVFPHFFPPFPSYSRPDRPNSSFPAALLLGGVGTLALLRNRNRRKIRPGRQAIRIQPRSNAPARNEHALRRPERKRLDGNSPKLRPRHNEPRSNRRTNSTKPNKKHRPQRINAMSRDQSIFSLRFHRTFYPHRSFTP